MITKINCFIFALISIALLINLQNPTASTTADVKYDGNKLSVHADGVELDQLLSMVAEQTGIQFSYNDLVADIDVFINFESSSLVDGIRRILLHFNYAVIYDGLGQVNYVLVLNRQGASSESQGYHTELFASLQETDINEMADQLVAHPTGTSGMLPDQVETTPFSGQISWQEASGPDSPLPGADESEIPPSGEESQTPVVDPNAPPPPGEEALTPVVDPNASPPPDAEPLAPVVDADAPAPPGEDPLEVEPDAESTFPLDTEGQAVPKANQNPG